MRLDLNLAVLAGFIALIVSYPYWGKNKGEDYFCVYSGKKGSCSCAPADDKARKNVIKCKIKNGRESEIFITPSRKV